MLNRTAAAVRTGKEGLMMKCKRWLAGLLAALLLLPPATALAADGTEALTRGQARDLLLAAADDYHPGVTAEQILHGDETGALHEDRIVTRAEAMVMLSRAFGTLPEPAGDSARRAYDAGNFTDLPVWAKEELNAVLQAGIVAGTSATAFSPNAPMTRAQLETMIRRVYALEGSNLKDDFYAAVNKEWLDASEIPAGYPSTGTIYEMTIRANEQVAGIIEEIVAGSPAPGSKEAAIKNLYENVTDWDARNRAGIDPIRPWLEAIDSAESLDELMEVHCTISKEAAMSVLMGFGLATDLKDSTRNILAFESLYPSLGTRESYEDGTAKDAYLRYLTTLLTLGGRSEAQAAEEAAAYFALEKELAGAMMDRQDYGNADRIYNLYTMEQLQAVFPAVDLREILAATGLAADDKILVQDPGLLQAAAAYFDDAHLELLKTAMRLGVLSGFGGVLSQDFTTAAQAFQSAMYGVEGSLSDEEITAQQVQAYLSDYLGEIYVETYFSAAAKADVEAMIEEFRAIYKARIQALDWMSDATKARAIEKLEAMTVNVGYPDQWDDAMDAAEIRSASQGGSYFENALAMSRAARDAAVRTQNEPVDKGAWQMSAYTVNAYYDATANSINFPAAILQAPLYDVKADNTENLGGIGYVIAHEMTHAFDNNGAKFDAEGNAADWWTAEDYAAFQALCADAVAFYDGVESIPGVVCNGTLTLSENVADLGAVACITEAEGREARPDYQTLYEAAARTWRGSASREMSEYLSVMDVHAPDKLRGSRALQSCDAFYEAFDIQPGDGMYLPPEARVQIW